MLAPGLVEPKKQMSADAIQFFVLHGLAVFMQTHGELVNTWPNFLRSRRQLWHLCFTAPPQAKGMPRLLQCTKEWEEA